MFAYRWQQGRCNYGDTCKYAHGERDIKRPAGLTTPYVHYSMSILNWLYQQDPTNIARVSSVLHPDTACRFQAGYISRSLRTAATLVTFLCTPPGGAGGGAPFGPGFQGPLYKTRMCYKFMDTGSCEKGDMCNFAHGQHDLRPEPNGARGTHALLGIALI